MKFLEKCNGSSSSRPFWNKINQIRTGKTGGSIPTLRMNGMQLETNKEKAKILSETLANTFANDEETTEEQEAKVEKTINDFIRTTDFRNWGLELVHIVDVINVLKELSVNGSWSRRYL
jgi:hypothetical protein